MNTRRTANPPHIVCPVPAHPAIARGKEFLDAGFDQPSVMMVFLFIYFHQLECR